MMASRGFLKDVGGQKRMRFVKAPHDANNLAVPNNQVIFDSEDIGNLSIYRYGEWASPQYTGTGVKVDSKVITWPTLPYIPLITLQCDYSLSGATWTGWAHAMTAPIAFNQFRMWCHNDGLHVYYEKTFNSDPDYIAIRWQTYRFST
ncbi:hypothetical protein [Aquamicrobium sp. LC103]|uniref:hypothetical protein n=1 Tax=Aquamicrobium sp. LC103 TaxID=1120658 RepID=UPI00063E991E|nr:hypothetical protein [Aquamicrobium sp. LC103]TKT79962.1 hypothetical protein XW59_006260 [Aquamicrobium sp. LC103]